MPTIETYDNRADWLTARYDGIGASEAAGILGLSRFSSPWSIWREKTDRPAPDLSDPSELAEWGRRHEPAIAAKLEEELRKPNMPGDAVPWPEWSMVDPGGFTTWWADDPPWLFCTPDRLLVVPQDFIMPSGVILPAPQNAGKSLAVCELKCAWYEAAREWKTAIPIAYRMQCQVQMRCVGVDRAYYAALLNGHEFRWFVEMRNDRFMGALLRRLEGFWNNHVLAGIAPPPDWSEATAGAIAAHQAKPVDVEITLAPEFDGKYRDREAWLAEITDRKRKVTAIDNAIKIAMGLEDGRAATTATLNSNAGAYTWRSDKNGRRSFKFRPKGERDE